MVSDKVSTETNTKLHDYELIVIISPEVAEEQSEAARDKVTQFITGNGGTIIEVEPWGKRRLAYPIKHFVEGNYSLIKFNLEPTFSRELESNLKISEEVLRHLLIRLDS